MIAAIMQPYFFPYIGYFQLMSAVDLFVIFDDVQYIDRGWVNRNKFLFDGKAKWLTYPVLKGKRSAKINERYYVHDYESANSLKRKVQESYLHYPYFKFTSALFSEILDFDDRNVARFNANLLKRIGDALDIKCEYTMSSAFTLPSTIKGQERIIALCKGVGASHYVNPVGGSSLYQHTAFSKEGIELSFLETHISPEALGCNSQYLSILDGLMRIGPAGCKQLLSSYALLHDANTGVAT